MNKKKNKKNKLKTKLVAMIILLIILIGFTIALLLGVFNEEEKIAEEVKVVESLDDYGYTLEDNETEYYNTLFTELKEILNNDELDEEAYASKISQLFIADYFNLDNKLSKNDIGGTQFIYTDFQTDFINLSMGSVYKTVENNLYGDRNQTLPKVSKVVVTDVTTDSFDYNDETDESAYVVEVSIEYEEDMGYQEVATLTLIHSNNKLEIAKMS